MDADLFCNVLETTLIPFVRNKFSDHQFMQDNDPKHTSRRAQAFFEKESINWWRTPPESPDLNPIKDLWHELKFYLETKVKPRNKQELVDGMKFWKRKVSPEKCAKYIDHVLHKIVPLWWRPEVLQPSIKIKGFSSEMFSTSTRSREANSNSEVEVKSACICMCQVAQASTYSSFCSM